MNTIEIQTQRREKKYWINIKDVIIIIKHAFSRVKKLQIKNSTFVTCAQ